MSRPWMPLYVADYLADTGHLTGAEHGAYLLLIMHYWANAGLPDDDDRLARIARMTDKQWVKSKPIIAEFFSPGWKHARIEFELTEAARISAAGRAGGVASGESRRQRKTNDKRTTVERPLNDQANDLATKREALPSPSLPNGKASMIDLEKQLFERGKAVLGQNAGGLIAKLLKAKGLELARASIETAATKQNPREYIGRILGGPVGLAVSEMTDQEILREAM